MKCSIHSKVVREGLVGLNHPLPHVYSLYIPSVGHSLKNYSMKIKALENKMLLMSERLVHIIGKVN